MRVRKLVVLSLLALCVELNGSSNVVAQEQLEGVWMLRLFPKDKQDSAPAATKWLLIGQEGEKLNVLDLQNTKKPLQGKIADGHFEFPLLLWDASSDKRATGELSGDVGSERLSGSVLLNNHEYEWKASKLASIWACSNHSDPVHTAQTEEEMRRSSDHNGCKGWHPLNSSNVKEAIAALKRENDIGQKGSKE